MRNGTHVWGFLAINRPKILTCEYTAPGPPVTHLGLHATTCVAFLRHIDFSFIYILCLVMLDVSLELETLNVNGKVICETPWQKQAVLGIDHNHFFRRYNNSPNEGLRNPLMPFVSYE